MYQSGNIIAYIVGSLKMSLLLKFNLKSLYCHKEYSGWNSTCSKYYFSNNCRRMEVPKPAHK